MTHIVTITKSMSNKGLTMEEWCASKSDELLSAYPECAGKSCLDIYHEYLTHMENADGFIDIINKISEDGLTITTEVVWATPEDYHSYALSTKKFVGPGELWLDKNLRPVKDYYGNYLYKSPIGFLYDEWAKEFGVSATQTPKIDTKLF